MSTLSIKTTRKTRSTCDNNSNIFDDLNKYLHLPNQFIDIYDQYYQSITNRTTLINTLCRILQLDNIDRKIHLFILNCLTTNFDHISDIQFKQNLLPFIKQLFTIDSNHDNELLLTIIKLLIVLVEYRSNVLTLTLGEWLSCLLNFFALHLSSTNYLIYSDFIIDLLSKIVKQFTPLVKETIEILSQSSSIISTNFLNHLKQWIKNTDDIQLSLFAIHFWESLACLLSRLIIRNHSKGNELLAVFEDVFIVSNYSIVSSAFTIWSSFMLHIHCLVNNDSQQFNHRLLKIFLKPFLIDSTSKSKSASISKCHSWITLISIYPKNIHDIILPFLSFAFGHHITSETAWWSECRQIGDEFLHELLVKNIHSEFILTQAGDQILKYLFDTIVDHYTINNSLWLNSWNAYLKHLINIFKSNNFIHENQRIAINTCLLTRIEQLWIDSRIETRFLLRLFETFEQIGFPLAVETVLRDSSIRTKTLSAAQIHPTSSNHRAQDKYASYCTTLSDQYLHMMLEHAIRFNDDQTIEEVYLHVMSYLIDTLSKTSDENFCYQTSLLLLKCSTELSHQPLIIPYLFWHIWYRCSTHLINILNCSHTFELHNKIDNQKQETSIELLLRPCNFNDIQHLDYSYSLLWTQLFKALCRLALINNDSSNYFLIHLLVELLRNEPVFEQTIYDQYNQRLFGFILNIIKTILKTFSNIDLNNEEKSNNHHNNFTYLFSNTQKRLSTSSSIILCFTQISIIINHILQRLLSINENNTQYIHICCCLLKSNKISSSIEQIQSFIFTYVRDLIVDLFNLCKIYIHVEIIFQNLKQLIPFLHQYEQIVNRNLMLSSSSSSSIGLQKQSIDNVILNKILTIILLVFEPSNSSSFLQLIYPILILAFQHSKTTIRNKTRKCWNETFGRLTFIIYPNELRTCLRDLKDKEHLLLPCFLADHDSSNTIGSSGLPPSSTDESQLSQQVDIATPLISSTPNNQQSSKSLPSGQFLLSNMPSIHPTKNESIFVPITNHLDNPVVINKRLPSKNLCLTEKQKEKLRQRQIIPLLCDDNTQSNSSTIDTLTITNDNENIQLTSISHSLQDDNNPIMMKSSNEIENENSFQESSIVNKLRRSSISARKSLTKNTRRKRLSNKLTETNSILLSSMKISDSQIEKYPMKSILKRLSPVKLRHKHLRHVAFYNQVKVIVFSSPTHRDTTIQRKTNEIKSSTRIISKENLPLRKQTRRLNRMNHSDEQSSPMNSNRRRSSKLFHPNDALAEWTHYDQVYELPLSSNDDNASPETKSTDVIYSNLVDNNQSIDCLLNFLSNNQCSENILDYFHSNKINTIGDVARLTSDQMKMSPLTLNNIRKALSSYEEYLLISSIDNNNESSTPITNDNNTCRIESSSVPIEIITSQLPNVDTLFDSFDYEKLDNQSTNQKNFLSKKCQQDLRNRQEFLSSNQNCLSLINEENRYDQITENIEPLSNLTLGNRLQKAADTYKIKGILPFDNDYIELIRQLVHNSSLTHLEQLHLKALFFNH